MKKNHYLTAGSLLHEISIIGGLLQFCGKVTEIVGRRPPNSYMTIQLARWLKRIEACEGRVCRTCSSVVADSDTNQPLSHSDRPCGETGLGLTLLGYCRYTAVQHYGRHKSGAAMHLN